jgi:hypothetical protein
MADKEREEVASREKEIEKKRLVRVRQNLCRALSFYLSWLSLFPLFSLLFAAGRGMLVCR